MSGFIVSILLILFAVFCVVKLIAISNRKEDERNKKRALADLREAVIARQLRNAAKVASPCIAAKLPAQAPSCPIINVSKEAVKTASSKKPRPSRAVRRREAVAARKVAVPESRPSSFDMGDVILAGGIGYLAGQATAANDPVFTSGGGDSGGGGASGSWDSGSSDASNSCSSSSSSDSSSSSCGAGD